MPFASIVIVNFNGLRHLEECLDAVQAQSFQDFETIVVDNASTDGSVEYLRDRKPWVTLVQAPRNLGFSGGNNLGFRHCQGDFVLLLNNDTRMEPDVLSELYEATKREPAISVFACLLVNHATPSVTDSGGDTVYTNGAVSALAGYPIEYFGKERLVASACGAAALYRRSLLDRLGGFDEDFFLNYEDMDLAFRARHLGESILFVPSAKVRHKGSATFGGKRSDLNLFYTERNYPWFVVKNFPARTLLRILPTQAAFKLIRIVRTLLRGQFGTLLRANRECVKGLPRMLRKRREILGGSRLSTAEFEAMLRPGWLHDRLAALRGKDGFVP